MFTPVIFGVRKKWTGRKKICRHYYIVSSSVQRGTTQVKGVN